jgi:hypothetical protein
MNAFTKSFALLGMSACLFLASACGGPGPGESAERRSSSAELQADVSGRSVDPGGELLHSGG